MSGWNAWRVMSSAWHKHMVLLVAWWLAVSIPIGCLVTPGLLLPLWALGLSLRGLWTQETETEDHSHLPWARS